MHDVIIKFVLLLGGLSMFLNTSAENKTLPVESNDTINKIEILNIRSRHRCLICDAMVENTKSVLNTYFSDEMREKKIVFRIVDIDNIKKEEKLNENNINGVVLLLRTIIKGKKGDTDLTDLAFISRKNERKFSTQLRRKIADKLTKVYKHRL